jgi:hypothetical protein
MKIKKFESFTYKTISFNDFVKQTNNHEYEKRWRKLGAVVGNILTSPVHRPEIVCMYGFTMSVQGNSGAYSTPRTNSDWFEAMEIGFPSEREPLIMDYAEEPENPTQSVYGYVPTYIIEDVINKHGGIDYEATFNPKEPEPDPDITL